MQELIKINEKDGQQLVNARELYEFLESKQEFANWIKNRIEKYDFIEEQDFLIILSKTCNGRPSIDYALTLEMAKELCMVESNEKGKQARKYFIEVEKKYKAQIPKLSVLDTLKVAVHELEQKEIIIQEKNKQIEVMKPDYEFVNKVFKTVETNVKIGDFAQAAAFPDPNYPKTIIGQNKMFKLLKKMGILKNDNKPMTDLQNRGYFEVVEQIKGNIGKVFFTTYITPKGQSWLYRKIQQYLD